MSRIGKLPVKIPNGVTVRLDDHTISVKGGRGELSRSLHPEMRLAVRDDAVLVERPSESKQHRALHGLTRTLVYNMIEGVSKGFEKQLELVGVGYRASRQGEALVLNVGYSHPVRYQVPAGITVEVPEPTKIIVRGASKEDVGQVTAEIRKVRPPEPYKGKGIMNKGERIRRKAGKTGKTASAGATR
jgi:large subunit ribosomal protein L6